MAGIRKATEPDIARLARTSSRAFVDDPVMRWLIPDDDEYERDHLAFFGGVARRWMATESLWCTDDGVALAGWMPPGRPEVDIGDVGPRIEHPAWRVEKFKALAGVMDTNTPAEPHWYLNMLATHPDWQRQGLGVSLMQVVFEIADTDGLPCYLETETVENVAYYLQNGFEIRTEWDLPLDGPHMWGMFRKEP